MDEPGPHVSGGQYVSRGGLKLEHAIKAFSVQVDQFVCVDLGCSTGGFTDCLLKHGAARVYAVDTAYGQLAWTLRKDPRVTVLERSNALHVDVPREVVERGGVDLVVVDLGWTPQKLLVPAALRWMGSRGRMISLIKPHYEHSAAERELPRGGLLEHDEAEAITRRVLEAMPSLGMRVAGCVESPVVGGASKSKSGKGNAEWLALLERANG
jgi:23S rRNA (cytidine1920-2'-O)/16S rRNA (cytidine1409-2'-O)-methyltransferase